MESRELGKLKNDQSDSPREEIYEEAGRNKRIYKSQPVPLGAAQHLKLQQWYESRLKNYDSRRLRDALSDLLRLNQVHDNQANRWLRPSVPAIKNFSYRSQRPYVGEYKVSGMTNNHSAQKIKLPPISRQSMDVIRVGQFPFKPVKPATIAINQAHAVLKAYTESVTRQVKDEEYAEPTMLPYIPPAVYRKVTLIQQRYAPYTNNHSAQKIKLPPISRQSMDVIRVGQFPFKPVKPATIAINQAHAVLKAYTESVTGQVKDEEYAEPTMLPYIPPAVYRKVTLIQQRYAPYTLAVRLSNGCSGTLVTPLHVVTSAHCVYPATSSNNHSLKVEVPESMGYRVHYVDGVYVPRGYRIAKGYGQTPNYAKAVYDYAVITLNTPIPGRKEKEFPRIASVDVHRLGSMGQIHIIGYPTDTYPQMWQSSCSFLDSRPALGGNFVTSSCVSSRGMGGAAALLDSVRTRDEMKMIGIATNMVLNEPTSIGDQKKSLVLIFTPNKVAEICQQIRPWDQGGCV